MSQSGGGGDKETKLREANDGECPDDIKPGCRGPEVPSGRGGTGSVLSPAKSIELPKSQFVNIRPRTRPGRLATGGRKKR